MESFWRKVTLETGLVAGAVMLLFGGTLAVMAVLDWRATDFGSLDPQVTLRLVIPAVTLLSLGAEAVLSSFLLSILGLQRHDESLAAHSPLHDSLAPHD
jgi:hypothetical protein